MLLCRRCTSLAVALLAFTAMGCLPALAKDLRRFHTKVDLAANGEDRVIAGGAKVTIRGKVLKDVWAAGADVDIEVEAGDDIEAKGGRLRIAGKAGGDVNVLGADVTLDAAVGDDLWVRGVDITIGSSAAIADDAIITGTDTVAFSGSAGGDVELSGKDVTFSGAAKGEVQLVGPHVAIGPSAKTTGAVTVFTIGEPEVAPGAEIGGQIVRRSLYEAKEMRPLALRWLSGDLMLAVLLGASALAVGLLLLGVGRDAVEDMVDEVVERLGRSTATGLIGLIAVPAVAVLAGFTIVGIPFGAALLAALPLLMLIGLAASGFGLGEWLFNRLGEPRSAGARALMLLAGIAIIAALGLIPYAGPVLVAIAALIGFGAALRAFYHRLGGAVGRLAR